MNASEYSTDKTSRINYTDCLTNDKLMIVKTKLYKATEGDFCTQEKLFHSCILWTVCLKVISPSPMNIKTDKRTFDD